jgi:hypothetical protein
VTNKSASAWRAVPNDLLDFKPHKNTNSMRTILGIVESIAVHAEWGRLLMAEGKVSLVTLAVKTAIVHTVTYSLIGFLAFTVLDYGRFFAEPHMKAVMRQTDDPWVMAGPLFQPVRGLLFALAFYPLRGMLFSRKGGWLVLWLELVVLGILSPFGASLGSVEGMIYMIWPVWSHVIGLPEVLLQSLLLSAVLCYWVRHPEQKWLSWTLGILLVLVLLLPALGLLTRAESERQAAGDYSTQAVP